MGGIVHRWPCHCSWITWWDESKIKELERWTGREEAQGKRWEDQSLVLQTWNLKIENCLSNSHMVYVWKALEQIQSYVEVAGIGYTSSVLALRHRGLRNCEDFICKTCSTATRATNPFPICITTEINLKLLVSSVILVITKILVILHVLDQLGRKEEKKLLRQKGR